MARKATASRKAKAKSKRRAKGYTEQAQFLSKFDSKPSDSIEKIYRNFMRLARSA